jgi:antitoxin YefM
MFDVYRNADERLNVRYNKIKRGDIMTAITATKARENIYQLIQDVNVSCTPITITNTRGKNAVLIGEEDWKAIEETLYLMSIPGMAESIIEGGNTDISECLDESEVDW